jgi:hypothetical protein
MTLGLVLLPACGCAPGQPAAPTTGTAICFVPEMESIQEADEWPACRADAYAAQTERVRRAWKALASRLEAQVTPQRVQGLSRWAGKQMEMYRYVPPLVGVALKPVAADRQGDRLLFEGTIDTLPSHHPGIVTRWLKVFLIYDARADAIEKATVTIRGQVLE